MDRPATLVRRQRRHVRPVLSRLHPDASRFTSFAIPESGRADRFPAGQLRPPPDRWRDPPQRLAHVPQHARPFDAERIAQALRPAGIVQAAADRHGDGGDHTHASVLPGRHRARAIRRLVGQLQLAQQVWRDGGAGAVHHRLVRLAAARELQAVQGLDRAGANRRCPREHEVDRRALESPGLSVGTIAPGR